MYHVASVRSAPLTVRPPCIGPVHIYGHPNLVALHLSRDTMLHHACVIMFAVPHSWCRTCSALPDLGTADRVGHLTFKFDLKRPRMGRSAGTSFFFGAMVRLPASGRFSCSGWYLSAALCSSCSCCKEQRCDACQASE